MRASILLLCSLALAVIVGGFWLASGESEFRGPPEAEIDVQSPVDPETGDPLETRSALDGGVDDSAFDSNETEDAADSSDGDAERRSLLSEAARPEPSPATLKIRVVDSQTKQPVAGAEVFCLQIENSRHRADLGDLPIRENSAVGARHLVDATLESGRRYVADERGEVEVIGPFWRLAVAARKATLIGFEESPRGKSGPLSVMMVPDGEIRFVTKGFDGLPRAGVRIVVSSVASSKSAAVHWEGATDEHGRVDLRHASLILDDSRAHRLFAIAQIPTPAPVIAEFRFEPSTEQEIELRLPPAGVLDINVCDSGGTPLISAADVMLRVPKDLVNPALLASIPRIIHNNVQRFSAKKAFDSGGLSFFPVALGVPVEVYLILEGRGRAKVFGPSVATPPVRDGDVSELRLLTPPTWVVLRGRILDQDGSAHPARAVRAVVTDSFGQRDLGAIRVAEDGRIEVVVDIGERVVENARLELSVTSATTSDTRPEVLVSLGRLQPNDHRQLGDLTLRPAPPRVTGVIRDDRGEPVQDARVEVMIVEAGRTRTSAIRPGGSDADGRYALFGTAPPNALRVRVVRQGHLTESTDFSALPETHDVMLTRTATVDLSIRVPPACPASALEARLTASDGQTVEVRMSGKGERLSWSSDALRRGIYELTIGLRNVPGIVHRESGIVADPDRPRSRVRVDLRDRLFAYSVIAVRSDGTPDRSVSGHFLVRMTELDGSRGWRAFPMRQGEIRFVAFQQAVECTMFATGQIEASQWLRAGENRIITKAAQPIRVSVPGLRAVAGDSAIRISLVFVGDTGFPESIRSVDQNSSNATTLPRASLGKSGGGVLGADETATIAVSRPGRYEVVARFDRSRKPRVSVDLGQFDGLIDGLTPQEVRIPFDAEKVRAALAK